MVFLHQDIMALHPFWAATITIITAYMSAIGIGWLWARTAQWRELRKQSRWCDRHLQTTWRIQVQWWWINAKWTVIQIYQKLTRRRYK